MPRNFPSASTRGRMIKERVFPPYYRGVEMGGERKKSQTQDHAMEKKINDSLKIKHRHDTLWIHVTPWRSGQHEGSEVTVPHCLRGGKEEGLNSAEGQWARTKPDEGTTGETVLDDRSEEKPRHFLRNPEARRFSSCSFTVSHLSVLVQRHRLSPLPLRLSLPTFRGFPFEFSNK